MLEKSRRKNTAYLRKVDTVEEIKEIFYKDKVRYGVRRVHKELVNIGYNYGGQDLINKAHPIGKRPKEKYHFYKLFISYSNQKRIMIKR